MTPATAARVEDAAWLAETGESWDRAADRLGMSPETLEKLLYRTGNPDIWRRLRRNDWKVAA
ncbi:hypothetical protein GCM10025865_00920 [Paraoerskovia sediminicola]|uniref:Uncharacterized protein n=1 Tax=Paraoerskovia sediminicola TaxID=1138587 RepID=A0ABN6XBD5_9CELL|nr:hypothetical protein [Paraoerskovia sediminicola]BDZ40793.1 hypothetical protein GCM10025865_00920 [Paraoerskovia sediminicola]